MPARPAVVMPDGRSIDMLLADDAMPAPEGSGKSRRGSGKSKRPGILLKRQNSLPVRKRLVSSVADATCQSSSCAAAMRQKNIAANRRLGPGRTDQLALIIGAYTD